MAQVIVRDLLRSDNLDAIGIADINFRKAREMTRKLRDGRITAMRADARQIGKLSRKMRGWDVAVNSTWYEFNMHVMAASIRAGIHYVDLGGLYHMTRKQLKLNRKALRAKVACVLGMGSTPGTMNVMAADAASRLDRVRTLKLRSGSVVVRPSDMFQPPFSIRTIVDEFTKPAVIFRNGRICEVPARSIREEFRLPQPVGVVEGYYVLHSELATLPYTIGKGLRNTDFAISYPKDFSDLMVNLIRLGFTDRRPVVWQGRKFRPYSLLTAVVSGLPEPESPELDVDIQKLEAYGTKDGSPTKIVYSCISYPDFKNQLPGGAVGTGTPPSIVAQWLASGKLEARGVLPPELCIDPPSLFKELRKRGIRVLRKIVNPTLELL